MSFSQKLKKEAEEIWQAWYQHPFITGIGDGSLQREKFEYWIRQDYVYLIEYARVFAFAAGKANKLQTMQQFARLLDGTLNTEMELHRNYANKFGISHQQLEEETKSPTCQAYTDFLVKTAATGSLAETAAALLPCFWGFLEIGKHLARTGDTSEKNPYRDWIEMYSSDEFKDLASWSRELMNRLAAGCTEEEEKKLKEIFITSSRYELAFWEMAEKMEEWEV